MGLFDFLKKYKNENVDITRFDIVVKTGAKPVSKPSVDMEHLTDEGELPWGWIMHNKEFTGKIGSEYTHFLNSWLDARKKSPKELYPALKSFVLYLEDAEKLCKSKGECFEFWFYGLIASKEYIEKRKNELEILEADFESLQSEYCIKQNLLIGLEETIMQKLIENDGILQSDFIKLFDPLVKSEISEILYFWDKKGKIIRQKSGRSYILHLRG